MRADDEIGISLDQVVPCACDETIRPQSTRFVRDRSNNMLIDPKL